MTSASYELLDSTQSFVVINKSPGFDFHSVEGKLGVFEQVKQDLQLKELFPVHRLDKMTSGLLVFAKDKATAQALGQLFEQRKVEKYYLAISDKKPKKKQGTIKGDMATARRGSYKLLLSKDNPAVTQFFSHSIGEGKRAYLLKPLTGKTHQLRVALKSIAAPILGDQRYYPDCPNVDRGYLHAYQISFTLDQLDYRYQCLPTIGDFFCTELLQDLLFSHWNMPESLQWPKV